MDESTVLNLVSETLGMIPLRAERMILTHSGNTIYEVVLASGSVIVRLHENSDSDTFSHTVRNIEALAQCGLPIPRVLVSDTTMARFPFQYVILKKIPGRDLLYELPYMTPDQMTRLAEQIVDAQRKVGTLPSGTGFGWGPVGGGGKEAKWFDVLEDATDREGNDFPARLHRQRVRLQPYFRKVTPVCFLEDLTTKNIILQDGELQGLIDFDNVCFGDPFWMIGLAAGCIANDIGTGPLFYIEELKRCWELSPEQETVVTYYSANRLLEFYEDAHAQQDEKRITRVAEILENWLQELEGAD